MQYVDFDAFIWKWKGLRSKCLLNFSDFCTNFTFKISTIVIKIFVFNWMSEIWNSRFSSWLCVSTKIYSSSLLQLLTPLKNYLCHFGKNSFFILSSFCLKPFWTFHKSLFRVLSSIALFDAEFERESVIPQNHGGAWRTMHCRLCINCYGTG